MAGSCPECAKLVEQLSRLATDHGRLLRLHARRLEGDAYAELARSHRKVAEALHAASRLSEKGPAKPR